MPTSVLPVVFTETPTLGTLTGAGADTGGCGVIMPVTPVPPGAGSPGPNELISANPLVIAGVTIAGLTYEPDTKPFTKLEFRKVPMEFPSAPSKKSRSESSQLAGCAAAFVAADIGEVSCFNDDGIDDVSCCSCDCTPAPVLAPFACAIADPCVAWAAGFDVSGGWVNALTDEAAAEVPA